MCIKVIALDLAFGAECCTAPIDLFVFAPAAAERKVQWGLWVFTFYHCFCCAADFHCGLLSVLSAFWLSGSEMVDFWTGHSAIYFFPTTTVSLQCPKSSTSASELLKRMKPSTLGKIAT